MARHILICLDCNRYTMSETCKACAKTSVTVRPPKYSPDDKYAEMKREIKTEQYQDRGLVSRKI